MSDIQNGTLRRLIGRVKLPRANQEDIGAVIVAQDGIVVQESDAKGKNRSFLSIFYDFCEKNAFVGLIK